VGPCCATRVSLGSSMREQLWNTRFTFKARVVRDDVGWSRFPPPCRFPLFRWVLLLAMCVLELVGAGSVCWLTVARVQVPGVVLLGGQRTTGGPAGCPREVTGGQAQTRTNWCASDAQCACYGRWHIQKVVQSIKHSERNACKRRVTSTHRPRSF